MQKLESKSISRRCFLKRSLGITVAAAFPHVALPAADNLPIKIGLIGCGGRGIGAANDARTAAGNAEVLAVADIFRNRTDEAQRRFNLKDSECFVGFDAYAKLLDNDKVNYVIIATPSGFHPRHLQAAIESGKHVFMEKSAATDCPGARSVIKSGELAKRKGLGIVTGAQRRHQPNYAQDIRRLQDGVLGEITALRANWVAGDIWQRKWDPALTDTENQARNWFHHVWAGGDWIVEMHIHNLDVCNWLMKDHPVTAAGTGQYQEVRAREDGDIYYFFDIVFEYRNGTRLISRCGSGKLANVPMNVGEYAVHNGGQYSIGSGRAGGMAAPRGINPYQQEHADLIESIRAGNPINEAQQMAESTLTCIMGREAAYTGQPVKWETVVNSKMVRVPEKIGPGPMPVGEVAVPGKYQFS